MVFFVAFENSFFWKEYFDNRWQAKSGNLYINSEILAFCAKNEIEYN